MGSSLHLRISQQQVGGLALCISVCVCVRARVLCMRFRPPCVHLSGGVHCRACGIWHATQVAVGRHRHRQRHMYAYTCMSARTSGGAVSYTHLRAHETSAHL
eukprot:5404333-Alexandrium_andersonii.AAC.1